MNNPEVTPALSSRAQQLLLALAASAPNHDWTLLDAPRLAGELGVRSADLLVLLRELEVAGHVERWPLGSLVYLTERGRSAAAELDRAA